MIGEYRDKEPRLSLSPLARILKVRAGGENPDYVEAENTRVRQEQQRDVDRKRAKSRLLLILLAFICCYGMVLLRMWSIATLPIDDTEAQVGVRAAPYSRSDIIDREGRILATNMSVRALYSQKNDMVDPRAAADGLAKIFPELDADDLYGKFTGPRNFYWVREHISPEQMQQVHDLGEPGLIFGRRDLRLYPNGQLAAHVLGGYRFGQNTVREAEIIGIAGVEKFFEDRLRAPEFADAPLQLSLDVAAQASAEQALEQGVRLMQAKGGAVIVMDAQTGEVLTLASYPTFDPNDRPVPLTEGDQADSPLFNRAVQGRYELGSVFKPFTAAQALALGIATPDTMVNTKGPLVASRESIRDFHPMPDRMSLSNVIVQSSNVGTGRVALQIGADRQQQFLTDLGLVAPLDVELLEAAAIRPRFPRTWRDISTVTISYGHGLSVSPLHLAQAYARLLNDGRPVRPTLLRHTAQSDAISGGTVALSDQVRAQVRGMLRQVVSSEDGTASFARIPGYDVGGKTGTADKAAPRGGYYDDKVITTFASVVPADDPRYVIVVTLDEPEIQVMGKVRRTAGYTAVPVAGEVIRRVMPILGMAPNAETYTPLAMSLTRR